MGFNSAFKGLRTRWYWRKKKRTPISLSKFEKHYSSFLLRRQYTAWTIRASALGTMKMALKNFVTFVPNSTQLPVLKTVNTVPENLEFYIETTQEKCSTKTAKCTLQCPSSMLLGGHRQRGKLEFFLKEILRCSQYYLLYFIVLRSVHFFHNKKREWSTGQAYSLTRSCLFLICLWVLWRAKPPPPPLRNFV